MLFSLRSVVLSIALSAHALPAISLRQASNSYCQQLLTSCAASPNALTNPWSIKSCIFGATCFGGQHPVDGFLSALAGVKNSSPAPTSANVPRVSQAVFNSISTNGQVITQQNYIDGVFGTLATTNGPFPDASLVINDYNRVTVWTAVCNGQGIPLKNFADYYEFSSTVSSPGCRTMSTRTISVISTPIPVLTATSVAPARSSSATPAGITSIFTIVTGTFVPFPVSTPGSIPGVASCNKMFNTCVAQVNKAVSDAWSHPACLYAATCFGGQRPVDGLLSTVFGAKNTSGAPPSSVKETRLSTATMKKISTNGSTITLQNWIDGYFGVLSSVGGPFPASANGVIADFSRIQAWTGFCKGGIPFKNVADYFQFSASVSSNTSC